MSPPKCPPTKNIPDRNVPAKKMAPYQNVPQTKMFPDQNVPLIFAGDILVEDISARGYFSGDISVGDTVKVTLKSGVIMGHN